MPLPWLAPMLLLDQLLLRKPMVWQMIKAILALLPMSVRPLSAGMLWAQMQAPLLLPPVRLFQRLDFRRSAPQEQAALQRQIRPASARSPETRPGSAAVQARLPE